MFFSLKREQKVVMDYQLIYDTDSFIQLDFYAEGIKQEPLLYKQPLYLERVSYGFLTGELDAHTRNENLFQQQLLDKEWNNNTSLLMVKSIRELQRQTKKIEKSLKENILPSELWESYFHTIAHVISFKRFSDEAKPSLFTNDLFLFENKIKSLRLPSHILLFYQKLERLKDNPTNDSLDRFIRQYGFLYDFNIEETIFEKEESLKEKLKVMDKRTVKPVLNKRFIEKDFSVQLYKRIVWYEELRHYYQARAVRNYRKALELLNLNIYRTGIDTFHLHLKRGDTK